MRSRAERLRVAFEWAARGLGIAALALLLWGVLRPAEQAPAAVFDGRDLAATLVDWTRVRPADSVHVELASAPDGTRRDWLRALGRSGIHVSWRAPGVPALAVAAEPLAEPRGRAGIAVAAPEGVVLAIRDAVGPVDSLTSGPLGASAAAPLVGAATVSVGAHHATGQALDSVILRRLLVIGAANWETRFVIATLEELGWSVEARIAVAPGAVVRQGRPAVLDTARYSAVIALDTLAASEATAIGRFVRDGGGLVLAGTASRAAGLARLAPGRLAPRWQPTAPAASAQASLATLGYHPLRAIGDDAVILGVGGAGPSVAAHRVGTGRVVQVGHDETWRWRMAGGDEGPAAHRAWWGSLVSAAAFTPLRSDSANAATTSFGDAAPLASLAAVLGPPRAAAMPRLRPTGPDARLETALLALAIVAFLGEWASRRTRGAA